MMITIDGLVDQVLGIVVAKERPDLEEEKARLTTEGAENARQLAEVENKIIEVLGSSEGSILEVGDAIDVITNAKELSNEINGKQAIAKKTEITIDETREGYRPSPCTSRTSSSTSASCATSSRCTSTRWRGTSTSSTTRLSLRSDRTTSRSVSTTSSISSPTRCTRTSAGRCSRRTNSVLIHARRDDLHVQGHDWTPASTAYLLTGGIRSRSPTRRQEPCKWLNKNLWLEMLRLSDLPAFDGFADAFRSNPDAWQHIYDSANPESEALAGLDDKLLPFQKLSCCAGSSR